jgi:hypothetical protein
VFAYKKNQALKLSHPRSPSGKNVTLDPTYEIPSIESQNRFCSFFNQFDIKNQRPKKQFPAER